jgi:membrane protein DedA with SNARE-associated domain/membrane-associated phospholipid phosphatase
MFSETMGPILQWLNAHPQSAGFATFVISAIESIAVIGTIIPGTVMMTAIGTLAGAGVIPLWSTLIWAILGAVVGDGVSYWFGYKFKDRLRQIWPFRKNSYLLDSGERFFTRYGGMSVFIGRFIGPVRAVVPLVAGMLGMSPLRFAIANITSAIGWAPAYMLPGILLGAASLELPPDVAVHVILMLLLSALFIIFCVWMGYKFFKLIRRQTNQLLTIFWNKLYRSEHFALITSTLKHADPNKTHGQLVLAFNFILVGLLLCYLALTIYWHGSANLLVNNVALHFFRSLRTTTLDPIMLAIALLGEKKVVVPVALMLFIWLGCRRRWHTAWHVLGLAVLAVGGIEVFKILVHSPRPWGILHSPATYSFPSGHATLAVSFYLGLSLLLAKAFMLKRPAILHSLFGILIILICISRVYLGAHWVTDVVGGLLLGTTILIFVILSYNRQHEQTLGGTGILAVVLFSLIASYTVVYSATFNTLSINSTAVPWPKSQLTLNNWWDIHAENVPIYRVNRFGLSTQILNLQWLANLTAIKTILEQNGWQPPAQRDWITVVKRLSDVESTEHLPIVSPLYFDKRPVLILIKHLNGDKKLIVLRLWEANVTITDANLPLWVGVVDSVPRTYSWLFKHRPNSMTLSEDVLFDTSPSGYIIQINHSSAKKPIVMIKPSI